jgi:hypothetical protein
MDERDGPVALSSMRAVYFEFDRGTRHTSPIVAFIASLNLDVANIEQQLDICFARDATFQGGTHQHFFKSQTVSTRTVAETRSSSSLSLKGIATFSRMDTYSQQGPIARDFALFQGPCKKIPTMKSPSLSQTSFETCTIRTHVHCPHKCYGSQMSHSCWKHNDVGSSVPCNVAYDQPIPHC